MRLSRATSIPRVRWDGMVPRPIEPKDLEKSAQASGSADFVAAVKEVKTNLKGPLADKQPICALNFRRLGRDRWAAWLSRTPRANAWR